MSKKSLGYGFVRFAQGHDASTAILKRNGHLIGGKKIKVSVARAPSEEIRNSKLYISNLPKTYGEREIRQLFSQVSCFPSFFFNPLC